MNKKGFTLIELLITIVIMALILIMVMPSITALRNNNEKKAYEYYGDSLIEAAEIYVNREGEDINPIGAKEWTGCVDISYQDLLNADLIKPYNDENIDCSNAKVRYTKEKNKGTYTINLSCIDKSTSEVVYKKNEISNDTCKVIDLSDITPPVCGEITGASTEWTKEDREITIKCSDESGCNDVTKKFTETTKVGTITVTDMNGNETECPVDVYVDKTAPTCISSGGNEEFVTGPITLTGTCSDSDSGCVGNVTKVYNEIGEWVNQSPGTVKDSALNETICPNDQTVRINAIELTRRQ